MAITAKVMITTGDGHTFRVDMKVAKMSKALAGLLENWKNLNTPILIAEITSDILEKIIQWAEKHCDDQVLGNDNELWDQEFINVDKELLFEIYFAAEDLKIKGLQDLAYKALVKIWKDKGFDDFEEVDMLHIQSHHSPTSEL